MYRDMLTQAKLKIAEDQAFAERERRAYLARRTPSPDAVRFEPRVEHLSFAARVRAILDTLTPAGHWPTAYPGD